MPIAVDIFSGFLGAGKTMLIKKLISEGVYEKDLAIIENEFGEVAIDGTYLEESCAQIKEIYSGCICCSVSGDFKKAILDVLENYHVRRIIIEPSGVASLSDVLKVFKEDVLKEKLILGRIITVVDVSRFEMYRTNFSAFYKNQIQYAKTIVLSRMELLKKEQLEKVINEIRGLNASASIVTTPWSEMDGQMIAEADENSLKEELVKKMSQNIRGMKKVASAVQRPHAHDVFDTYGMNTLEIFAENKLRSLLSSLKDSSAYGEVLRAKGIVHVAKGKWVQFDYVNGEYEIRESKPYYTGKLCVIGTGLKKEALAELFKR
ncbi:MAG: cobalamin biosynthesis protein CobW [Clostridia bacterium]|jgi:G3E family GTPase|nr:cobalamin biosynthesis protein CobW [Clostridia bacterium]